MINKSNYHWVVKTFNKSHYHLSHRWSQLAIWHCKISVPQPYFFPFKIFTACGMNEFFVLFKRKKGSLYRLPDGKILHKWFNECVSSEIIDMDFCRHLFWYKTLRLSWLSPTILLQIFTTRSTFFLSSIDKQAYQQMKEKVSIDSMKDL